MLTRVLTGIALALAVLLGVQTWRLTVMERKHDSVVLKQKDLAIAARDKLLEYIAAVRVESGELRDDLAKVKKETKDANEKLALATDRERTQRLQHARELGRVRQGAADLARRAATDAQRQATANAIGVFADLYGRCDARAGAIAEEADRARLAGAACERAYDAVQQRVEAWNRN